MNEELREKIEDAIKVVEELDAGTRRWTLQVPANPNVDPDLIILDALVAARDRLKKVERLFVEFEAYDDGVHVPKVRDLVRRGFAIFSGRPELGDRLHLADHLESEPSGGLRELLRKTLHWLHREHDDCEPGCDALMLAHDIEAALRTPEPPPASQSGERPVDEGIPF